MIACRQLPEFFQVTSVKIRDTPGFYLALGLHAFEFVNRFRQRNSAAAPVEKVKIKIIGTN